MKKIILLSLIFLSILLSSCKSEAIQTVKDFLNEKNLQNKLNYVRKDSKYLRINGLEDLAKVLPKRYQDIRLAEEVVNENEVIVEVVTKKYSLGVFNSIDETFTFFVYNNKGEYKIDLDATFTKPDTTMKTMVRKGLKFSKELRAYVTESFMTKEEFQVNNKKVLTSIFDQETRENFCVVKENLYCELENIFSKTKFAHLILSVSYTPENNYIVAADSIIQKGWIIK